MSYYKKIICRPLNDNNKRFLLGKNGTAQMMAIGLNPSKANEGKLDPNGAYAAVIPKFVSQFMAGESPVINGNGEFSRDFTYIDNVIQANLLSITTKNKKAINTVYNIAFGERNTLKDLVELLKKQLTEFDSKIKDIQVIYGPNRVGDIPHSLAVF